MALTSSLGSNLVHMLYVLDEPSVGLHPADVQPLVRTIQRLRDRGNTVVVVEHEEAIIRAADPGGSRNPDPAARRARWQVVFQGTPAEMMESPRSLTGDFLAGRRGILENPRRRTPSHGWIRLAGARGNNLQNITVEFPLGVLCLVTGVSGAGKSTLVQDTLYPALRRRMHQEVGPSCPYDDIYGDGQLNDVIMVDQEPDRPLARGPTR